MPEITRFMPPQGGRKYPPFAQSVRHGPTLYVSGIGPMGPDGVPEGFEAQFALVMQHLKRALKEAGSDMQNILKANVLLTRIEDVGLMNRLYAEAFPADHLPARTTCVVAALPIPEFLLEIECIAAVY
ncbi:RidA family protein [Falsiroseomonas sp.]|jgi:2-iminobutanoate/2-iminopropanoate deaminase|uniref:RidA family protein n=1 Tax=Falsiroseomonas sp. TaxID=2870721 RepID=UPI003F6F8DC6